MSKQQEIVRKLVATLMDTGAAINALTDMGVDVHGTVMPSLVAAIRETVPIDVLGSLYQAYCGAIKQVAEERPVERAIRRALAAATSTIPDQAPAIEAHVVIRGLPQALSGSLAETPDGGLRMLSGASGAVEHGHTHRPGAAMKLVEQFFGYEDVLVFALVREVTVESSRLVRS